ncbi:unnamed protein product [Phytophthora fragariaefolia]|uniref:Unnamed protein product n=1 Tax=Phytophthora fragariaefolia TaxID=1490495 RepID=A0A9W6XDB4_9STRA|nr:unnamed protein product [Phytophthora fragariaefolia]
MSVLVRQLVPNPPCMWNKFDNLKPNLHILIHTAAGPVEPTNSVKVLFVDADDDEFIVGNDSLATLGIDVDRQLEQLAGCIEDETSGDGIDLEADESPVNLEGEDSSDDNIFAAVERLINRAFNNDSHLNEWRNAERLLMLMTSGGYSFILTHQLTCLRSRCDWVNELNPPLNASHRSILPTPDSFSMNITYVWLHYEWWIEIKKVVGKSCSASQEVG